MTRNQARAIEKDNQDILELRQKTEQTAMQHQLRTNLLGRMSSKRVIEYINNMRAQWQQAETTYQGHISELEREKEEIRFELTLIQEQIANHDAVVEACETYKQEASYYKRCMDDLHRQMESKQQQIDELQKNYKRLLTQKQSVDAELANISNEDNENSNHIKALEQKVQSLMRELMQRNESQKQIETENKELLAQIDELKEERKLHQDEHLQEKLEAVEASNSSLVKLRQKYLGQINELEATVNKEHLMNKEVAYTNADLKTQLQDELERIERLKKERSNIELEFIEVNNQLQTEQRRNGRLNQEIQFLTQKLDQERQKNRELINAFDTMNELASKIEGVEQMLINYEQSFNLHIQKKHQQAVLEAQELIEKASKLILNMSHTEVTQAMGTQGDYVRNVIGSFANAYSDIGKIICDIKEDKAE